jgi:hypothetical protein
VVHPRLSAAPAPLPLLQNPSSGSLSLICLQLTNCIQVLIFLEIISWKISHFLLFFWREVWDNLFWTTWEATLWVDRSKDVSVIINNIYSSNLLEHPRICLILKTTCWILTKVIGLGIHLAQYLEILWVIVNSRSVEILNKQSKERIQTRRMNMNTNLFLDPQDLHHLSPPKGLEGLEGVTVRSEGRDLCISGCPNSW